MVREFAAAADGTDWDHQDPSIAEALFPAFSTPGNTKEYLEDTFRDITFRSSQTQHQCSRFERYQYVVHSGQTRATTSCKLVEPKVGYVQQRVSDGIFVPPSFERKTQLCAAAGVPPDVGIPVFRRNLARPKEPKREIGKSPLIDLSPLLNMSLKDKDAERRAWKKQVRKPTSALRQPSVLSCTWRIMIWRLLNGAPGFRSIGGFA